MRRLTAGLTAMRTAATRSPMLTDAVIAGSLTALVLWEITTTDVSGPAAVLIPMGLLTTVPLVLRRRIPLLVLGAVIAGILVLDEFSVEQEPQTTLLPLLFDDPDSPVTELPVVLLADLWHRYPL